METDDRLCAPMINENSQGSSFVSPFMRRLFIPSLAIAMTGCAAIDWAGTEEEFIQRMEPVRKLMRPDEFDNSYRNALLESRPLPLTPSGTGRVAFLRKGSNCLYSSRSGGVTGPDRLGENPIAGKVVVFDQQGEPRFQLAQSTGDRFELMDADGDASTLELVRWSDRCEGSRPPFLVIYRLSDLSATPMLAHTRNPDAGQIRYTNTWDEKGEWTGRSMNKPHRKGRWRF